MPPAMLVSRRVEVFALLSFPIALAMGCRGAAQGRTDGGVTSQDADAATGDAASSVGDAALLDEDALATPAILIESMNAAQISAVVPNPLGGYVEARKLVGRPTRQEYSLQLRWVDGSLRALGDWHTAMTWPLGTENSWQVVVDQQGKALMLSFVFPPSLGSPPPPSMWMFSARWMDTNGPLTDSFQPIAPTYTAPNGSVYFADWDTI